MSLVLGPETSRRIAWKNGLGSTLELASDAAVPGGEWTWRLSIADVPAATPFSQFPGVDRFLACIEGPGLMVVLGDKSSIVPNEGESLAFAGEEAARGEPLGPGVRDVNLMVRRDRWSGRMFLSRDAALDVDGTLILVHAPTFSSPLQAELDGGAIAIAPGSTLIASGRLRLTAAPSSPAVVCALSSR